MVTISCHFFSIIFQSDPVHVFQSVLLNQPRLKFIPIYFCTYFLDLSRLERQSREKDSKSIYFFLAANTCTHRGPIFLQRAKRPRIVDVLGHWELSKIQRWRFEGMVGFSPVFHLFCKVSSDYRWIKQ